MICLELGFPRAESNLLLGSTCSFLVSTLFVNGYIHCPRFYETSDCTGRCCDLWSVSLSRPISLHRGGSNGRGDPSPRGSTSCLACLHDATGGLENETYLVCWEFVSLNFLVGLHLRFSDRWPVLRVGLHFHLGLKEVFCSLRHVDVFNYSVLQYVMLAVREQIASESWTSEAFEGESGTFEGFLASTWKSWGKAGKSSYDLINFK